MIWAKHLRKLRGAKTVTTTPQPKEEYMASQSILHTEAASRTGQRPTVSNLRPHEEKIRADRNEFAAGCMNLVLLRAQQCGRNYLTPEDFRRAELMQKLLDDMTPVEGQLALSAPQTLGRDAGSMATQAVSDALDNLSQIAREAGIETKRPE